MWQLRSNLRRGCCQPPAGTLLRCRLFPALRVTSPVTARPAAGREEPSCVGCTWAGAGYVGKLAVPLLRQRFAVRVFDLRAPAGGGEYVPGDATGHAPVLALAGVDAVIHGAMAAGDDAAVTFGASVTSVHQTLSAAHRAGVPHAVYLSSLSVYADPVSRRLDESAVPTPPTCTG
jgi:NAD dependent epimerase/dehydratase family